jgi:hypothetical protein
MVFSQGGLGWIPAQRERCDRMWERHEMCSGLDDLRPSDLFERNMYGAFVDDSVGLALRDRPRVERIRWESDFPRVETLWPQSQDVIKRLTVDMPDDEVDLMTATPAGSTTGRRSPAGLS